jgi:hypothetical protein
MLENYEMKQNIVSLHDWLENEGDFMLIIESIDSLNAEEYPTCRTIIFQVP